jgi:hypothetical protein
VEIVICSVAFSIFASFFRQELERTSAVCVAEILELVRKMDEMFCFFPAFFFFSSYFPVFSFFIGSLLSFLMSSVVGVMDPEAQNSSRNRGFVGRN